MERDKACAKPTESIWLNPLAGSASAMSDVVRCSVLHGVAVRCSVLQCVAVSYIHLIAPCLM